MLKPFQWSLSALPVFLAFSAASGRAHAQDQEFQFSWLDPDKRVYVLQNRRYKKAGRAIVWGMGGIGLSQPYRTNVLIEPRLGFYLSEAFGFEVFYSTYFTSKSTTFRNLEASSPSSIPQVREFRNQWALMFHWAPWYAKLNVFNALLYFDWLFQLGVGRVTSEIDTRTVVANPSVFQTSDATAFYLGSAMLFHVSDSFLVRVDLSSMFYQAPLLETSGANTWFSHFNVCAGLGLKL